MNTFTCYIFNNIQTIEAAREKVSEIRAIERNAHRIVWGWFSYQSACFSTGGEIGGCGKILLSLIKGANRYDCILIVVRHFDGKLGLTRVRKAYTEVASLCLLTGNTTSIKR